MDVQVEHLPVYMYFLYRGKRMQPSLSPNERRRYFIV